MLTRKCFKNLTNKLKYLYLNIVLPFTITPMNKLNNLQQTKNPENSTLNKVQTKQELLWVLVTTTEPKEDFIDLAHLNATHPTFINHKFSVNDMEYLENVKNEFLKFYYSN